MKKTFVLYLLVVLSFTIQVKAQIFDPVKWETKVVKVSDTEYDLIAEATIDDNWHLYSQSVPENGPKPTLFIFESNGKYLKKGNTKEGDGHEIDDPIFEMRIKYFDKKATFTQRIKLKTTSDFTVTGSVEFMCCNDTQCLPPKEVDLKFDVNS